MNYERKSKFALSELIYQLIEYTRNEGKEPYEIILPIEEYYTLALLVPDADFRLSPVFLGIPCRYTLKKQTLVFNY